MDKTEINQIETVKIYAIVFDDNVAYVGQSKDPDKRLREHEKTGHNYELKRKLANYDNYQFIIMNEVERQDANTYECHGIDYYLKLGYRMLNKKWPERTNQEALPSKRKILCQKWKDKFK